MSLFYDKNHMVDHNTVICEEWEHMAALIKALWDISHEKDALGEYAMCLTEEMGYRLDFQWVAYEDDDVVFCRGTELQEMIESAIQDSYQDCHFNSNDEIEIKDDEIAYEQGSFEDEID